MPCPYFNSFYRKPDDVYFVTTHVKIVKDRFQFHLRISDGQAIGTTIDSYRVCEIIVALRTAYDIDEEGNILINESIEMGQEVR
jgi:hypothetical protein